MKRSAAALDGTSDAIPLHLGIEQFQGDLIKTAPLGLRQGQELGHQGFRQFQGEAAGQPLGIELPATIIGRFFLGSGAGITLVVILLVRAIGAWIVERLGALLPSKGLWGGIVPGPVFQGCVIRKRVRAGDQDRGCGLCCFEVMLSARRH